MKEKINIYISYFNILYFVEIIYIMLALNIMYGSGVSIASGMVSALLLSVHIVMFSLKKGISRLIQLIFMELHIAYSFPFFINWIMQGINIYSIDFIFSVFRFFLCGFELLYVFLLTDQGVIEDFN